MTERFMLKAAVFLVLRRPNEVLLLKRANTGYQDGKYGLVSGHFDGDELATAAMAREAAEEAAIIVQPRDLKLVHVTHRLSRDQTSQERLDLFFECWQWTGEPRVGEPDKASEVVWYPLDRLPEATIPHVRIVLSKITADEPYSEYTHEPAEPR